MSDAIENNMDENDGWVNLVNEKEYRVKVISAMERYETSKMELDGYLLECGLSFVNTLPSNIRDYFNSTFGKDIADFLDRLKGSFETTIKSLDFKAWLGQTPDLEHPFLGHFYIRKTHQTSYKKGKKYDQTCYFADFYIRDSNRKVNLYVQGTLPANKELIKKLLSYFKNAGINDYDKIFDYLGIDMTAFILKNVCEILRKK